MNLPPTARCIPGLLAALSFWVLGCVAAPALAETEVAVGAVTMESEAGLPTAPDDVAETLEEEPGQAESGRGRNFEFVIAPIPSRNPQLGWGLGVPVMFIYRPAFAHPDERVWLSGAYGFYSENESWGGVLYQRMSFGGDRWRVQTALGHADINYDYYGIGGGSDRPSIELSQPMDLVMAEALRRVSPNLYLGLKAVYSQVEVGPKRPGDLLPPGIDLPDLKLDLTLAVLTPRLEYDTRDNEFYPRQGLLVQGSAAISRDAFGSDAAFENYKLAVNDYRPLGRSGVLASRIKTEYVAGKAPFFLFPAFGSGSDLRGYQPGTYRNRFLFTVQTEYRHRFSKRIGAVAFAGVGTVHEDLGRWGDTLPSAGAGLRWVIAPKNNISLRVDVARGRDDTMYYVGVGEAF